MQCATRGRPCYQEVFHGELHEGLLRRESVHPSSSIGEVFKWPHEESETRAFIVRSCANDIKFIKQYQHGMTIYNHALVQVFITDAFSAMRLAYCLFFTMKNATHASVSIDDVAIQELPIWDTQNDAQDELLDPKHLAMLLDRDGNGVVTLQEFVDTAKAVYRKRQHVANAVLGDGYAIRQVEFTLNVAVSLASLFVLIFFMCPSQVETAWQTLTIGVAVASVIFATTIREVRRYSLVASTSCGYPMAMKRVGQECIVHTRSANY